MTRWIAHNFFRYKICIFGFHLLQAILVKEWDKKLIKYKKLSKVSSKVRGSLTKNKTIKVLKQDKDGGVVIMDSSKYTEKCLGILEKKQFARINDDPTFSSYNAVETKFKFFYQNVFILLSGIPFLNCYANKD